MSETRQTRTLHIHYHTLSYIHTLVGVLRYNSSLSKKNRRHRPQASASTGPLQFQEHVMSDPKELCLNVCTGLALKLDLLVMQKEAEKV